MEILSKFQIFLRSNYLPYLFQNILNILYFSLGVICPISYNIAEFYIKQISVIPGHEQQCIENIKNFKNKFQIVHKNDEHHEEVYWKEVKIKKRFQVSFLFILITG